MMLSDMPSDMPSGGAVDKMQCEANGMCATLNLTGSCCPTMDNWTLSCCDGASVEETCALNNKCAVLGLTGSCCPTIDSKYLDCCNAVPDSCRMVGNCTYYSATQYLKDLAAAATSAAPVPRALLLAVLIPSWMMMAMAM
jgi:hypothetical protein